MAFSPKTLLTLVTLLVLATTQAHGLAIAGVNVTTLIVNTGLHCLANPASLISGNAPPLANVTVTLLSSNNTQIANATTNMGGTALITVNFGSLLNTIRNLLGLKVSIGLPIANCSTLANTTGTLQGAVQPLVPIVVNGVAYGVVPIVSRVV